MSDAEIRALIFELWRYATGESFEQATEEGCAAESDTVVNLYRRVQIYLREASLQQREGKIVNNEPRIPFDDEQVNRLMLNDAKAALVQSLAALVLSITFAVVCFTIKYSW